MITARRWSDNDTYLGPFTFARGDYYRTFAFCLRSTNDEGYGCSLRISIGRASLLVALPNWVLRPERKKVVPNWDVATVARLGRDWYWDITPREFSISLVEGHLDIHYGRVTHNSSTEQRWGCFLPWTQWRFVRSSLYGLDGSLFANLNHPARWDTPAHTVNELIENACPTVTFAFADFDGEKLTATTKIEEREWRFGTGLFKWLSVFRKPNVRRSLDIRFSGETGRRKGSWKGGTIGHSIDMRPGELHADAFKRYCAEHKMELAL